MQAILDWHIFAHEIFNCCNCCNCCNRLTDAAADQMSNFKERSATGIQYMIEKHTRLEVDISVQPNYVIIPHGGVYLE